MTNSAGGYRWTAVFDAGRFSEFFDGVETSEHEAAIAAVRQARLIRAARRADFAPYFTIKVGTGPSEMHGLTMPMADLDLDDQALASQIRAGAAERRVRDQSLQEAIEAAANRGPTTSPTASSSVNDQMSRIGRAVRANTASTLTGRLPTSAVHAAQTDGNPWPEELVEFFTAEKPAGRLTPYGAFFEADEMLSARTRLIESRDQMQRLLDYPDPVDLAEWSNEPAGSPTYAFLGAFIPIAGDDREYMIVDLRDGDLRGSVSVYQREGDVSGPTWVSVSAMLSDLAESLESGTAFDGVWIPSFAGATLNWDAP